MFVLNKRAEERADWIAKNTFTFPWWAQECIISNERIEEVPSV